MNREQKVAVFNKLMNQNFGNDPHNVTLKNKQLAIRLIFSELQELAKATGVEGTFQKLAVEANPPMGDDGFSFVTDTGDVDQVLQLDGLADVQYTLSWAVNMLGHSEYFPEAFDEVCRSNDSKACETMEDAEATKNYWENPEIHEGGGEHYIDTVVVNPPDDVMVKTLTYYVVKRKSDDKVRKALTYSPADFRQFCKGNFSDGKGPDVQE